MKANKAPEKIYLATTKEVQGLDQSFVGIAHSDPQDIIEPVEYIRKDEFIEKACDWLRTHSEADYFELIPVGNYCGAGNLNKKRMIEDFKKYMEGQ